MLFLSEATPCVHRDQQPGGPPQKPKYINISINFHHRTFKACSKDPTMLFFSYLGEHFQHHVPGVPREQHLGAPQQV